MPWNSASGRRGQLQTKVSAPWSSATWESATHRAQPRGTRDHRDPVRDLTDRAPGLGEEGLAGKIRVLEGAAARRPGPHSGLDALAAFGGLEIAVMAGLVLGAAAARRVVVDGFIATAAVLAASAQGAGARDYCVFAHRSAEPGPRAAPGVAAGEATPGPGHAAGRRHRRPARPAGPAGRVRHAQRNGRVRRGGSRRPGFRIMMRRSKREALRFLAECAF